MHCDMAIVGGGPVGCMTAAKMPKGHTVSVFEEHSAVGVPEQCAGLIAPRVVEMARAHDAVLNRIDGAVIHFPDERELRLKGAEVKAFVVDRRRFDERCLEMALDNGAEYHTDMKFKTLQRSENGVRLDIGGVVIESRLLIGADGYKSSVGKQASMHPAREFVRGIQADVRSRIDDQSSVDVWLGSSSAPGFFAWRIPCGDFSRVGLCVSPGHERPSAYLDRLLKKTGHGAHERIRLYSGMIPLGPPRVTSSDRLILVGDAAAQVKPLSGGGLFTGLTAAGIAAEVAGQALDEDDLSARSLRRYDRLWRDRIGKEIDRGYMVRKAFVRMSDDDLNQAGKVLDSDEARAVLSTGDIDHPTEIAGDLLRAAPGLLRFSPQLLASMFSRS